MITTIPYETYFNLIHGEKLTNEPSLDRDTKAWILFMKLHMMTSATFKSVSVWLTVYLASLRFFYLRQIQKLKTAAESTKTKSKAKFFQKTYVIIWIMVIFFINTLSCLPAYLFLTVRENYINEDPEKKYFYLDESDLNFKTKGLMFKLVFYSQSIFGKFIPCILLVIFTSLLVHELIVKKRAEKKLLETCSRKKSEHILMKIKNENQHRSLIQIFGIKSNSNENISFDISNTHETATQTNTKPVQRKKTAKKTNENKRATHMLTLICVLFLIAQLPLSILTLLSITMGDSFYNNVYMPLSDIMEMIVLVSNSINFILLVSMSSAFRDKFFSFFKFIKHKNVKH